MKKSKGFSNEIKLITNFLSSNSFISTILIIIFAIWFLLATLTPYFFEDGIKLEIVNRLELKDSLFYFSASIIKAEYLALFSFLICTLNFSFLHNKSRCYTTLSFATKRNKIFSKHFFAPIGAIIIIVIGIKLITLKLNYDAYGFTSTLPVTFSAHILSLIKPILVGSFCALLSCLLCGRTIEAVASGTSLLFLPTVLCAVSRFMSQLTLFGADFYSKTLLTEIFDVLNPFDFKENHCDGIYYIQDEILPLIKYIYISGIWILALCVSFCLLKLYFSKYYKPEYCGIKGHSRFLSVILSCTLPLVALGYFFESFVFYSYDFNFSSSSLLKYSLIGILIVIACAIICNAVILLSKSHIKYSIIGSAVCFALLGILAGINATDIFGSYNTLPKKEDIQEISLSIPYDEFLGVHSYDANVFNNNLTEPNSTTVFHTNEEKEIIIDLHNTVINNRNKDTNIRAIFTYSLKNGEEIHREYSFLSNEVVSKIVSMRTTKAGETYLNDILLPEKSTDASPISVDTQKSALQILSKYGAEKTLNNLTISDKQFLELRKIIFADLMSVPNETWYHHSSEALGTLNIFIDTYSNENEEYHNKAVFSIHIFPSMENTINALKSLDYYKYLQDKTIIKEAFVGRLEDFIHNGNASITGPLFSTEAAYSYITEIPDAELRRITDTKELNVLIEKAHPYYLFSGKKEGNLLLLVVEYENSTIVKTLYFPD